MELPLDFDLIEAELEPDLEHVEAGNELVHCHNRIFAG